MHKHEKNGCRPAQLLGPWAMDAQAFDDLYVQAAQILASGQYETVARESREMAEQDEREPYERDADGVAHLSCNGMMTRFPHSMQSAIGGTSTLLLQNAIRKAAADPSVKGIMMHVSSPGGCTEGMADVAAELARARTVKPVAAHSNGSANSAAYRLFIEADHITADPMATIGSVGVLMSARDTSELMRRAGIENVYAGTGDRKGLGMPGKKITEQDRADMQAVVNDMNKSFLSAVRNRRPGISEESFDDIKRAGIYVGPTALKMGMIDGVCTTEEAISSFKQSLSSGGKRALPVVTDPGAKPLPRSVMLTTEQLTQAKALPGCGEISAENADGKLLAAAMSLQQSASAHATEKTTLTSKITTLEGELSTARSALPKQIDPSVLSLVAMAAETEMQAAIDGQSLTPATAAELKAVLIGDPEKGQFNVAALASTGGKPLAVSVFSALRRNGRMPDVNKGAGIQPAPKAIPGAPEGKNIAVDARAEAVDYQKRQLQSRGLPATA